MTAWAVGVVLLLSPLGFALELVHARKMIGGFHPGGGATGAFRVPGESTPATDALADFQRLVEAKQWDKAFRTLAEVRATKPAPMIRTEDGFLVPLDLVARRMLHKVPAEGRQAFRVFHDATARSLLERDDPADEIARLSEIREQYLITSVGAAAVDRLGDAHFERGEFDRAEACWEEVLEFGADAELSIPRLRLKRATALARLGNWAGFDEATGALRKGYARESVTIGGREVSVAEALAELEKLRTAVATEPATRPAAPRLRLPATDHPAWEYAALPEATRDAVFQQLLGRGFNPAMIFSAGVRVAGDEARVYVNWLGAVTALDAATGKVAWQTVKPEAMGQRLQQLLNYGMLGQSNVTLTGGRLLVVGPDPERAPYVRLTAYEPASGKVLWNTATDPGMAEVCFLGSPLAVGDTIYAAALKAMRGELYLYALDAKTGRPQWDLLMGIPTTNNYTGTNLDLEPALAAEGGVICVMTNDGALLTVDAAEKRVLWAYTYGGGRRIVARGGGNVPWQSLGLGVVIQNGIAYFKDASASEFFAIDIGDTALVFKGEIEGMDAIVGLADGRLFLFGQDEGLGACEARTMRPKWTSSLIGPGVLAPLLVGDRAFAYSTKGLFELDTVTGRIVGMLSEFQKDPAGGSVVAAGDRLILVSDALVRAYAPREKKRDEN